MNKDEYDTFLLGYRGALNEALAHINRAIEKPTLGVKKVLAILETLKETPPGPLETAARIKDWRTL